MYVCLQGVISREEWWIIICHMVQSRFIVHCQCGRGGEEDISSEYLKVGP